MKKILHQIKSLFSDRDWDLDPTKLFGFVIVVAGLVGWWQGKSGFEWIIGFGAALISTGKFSKEG